MWHPCRQKSRGRPLQIERLPPANESGMRGTGPSRHKFNQLLLAAGGADATAGSLEIRHQRLCNESLCHDALWGAGDRVEDHSHLSVAGRLVILSVPVRGKKHRIHAGGGSIVHSKPGDAGVCVWGGVGG